jgi:acyl-CoA thioester hydrolase
MEIRIYYEDTDCGGIVYYANYFKYFERARTEFLEQRGLSVLDLAKNGLQFVVAHAHADYRASARYGDTLTVETTVRDIGSASLTFVHVIREKSTGRLLVEGSATLVSVDLDGKVKRLPQTLVQAVRSSSANNVKGTAKRTASVRKQRKAG